MGDNLAGADGLMTKVLGDFAGAFSVVLVRIGEQNGLFKALSEGEATAVELAERAGAAERYVREWLSAMAAAGYVTYSPSDQRFSLTPEQRAIFVEEGTPRYLPPLADLVKGIWNDEPTIAAAFRSGDGIPWNGRHSCLFCGIERFSRSLIASFLLDQWLPALDGAVARLQAGARVADIGCGRGGSTLALAQAFPGSQFFGYDFHAPSIDHAAQRARDLGLTNVTFQVAAAKAFPGRGYDLAIMVDALHDMGDPIGAARHVREALKPDGLWMVIEPLAGDRLEDNLTVKGQLAYAGSACICVPASLSQEVGLALGGQAGPARLAALLREAGFSKVTRVAEEAVNLVLEARP